MLIPAKPSGIRSWWDYWIPHSFLCRGQLPFLGFLFHLEVLFCCCLFFLKSLTQPCPRQLLGECYKPPATYLPCVGMIITAVKFCYPTAQNIPALMNCRHKTNSHNPRAVHKQKEQNGILKCASTPLPQSVDLWKVKAQAELSSRRGSEVPQLWEQNVFLLVCLIKVFEPRLLIHYIFLIKVTCKLPKHNLIQISIFQCLVTKGGLALKYRRNSVKNLL